MKGYVVLSLCCFGHRDNDPRIMESKVMLDEIYLQKIDLSDQILVIDKGGYIGESTRKEIAYAIEQGKGVLYASGELGGLKRE